MGLDGTELVDAPPADPTAPEAAETEATQQPAPDDGATAEATAQPAKPVWTPADTQALQQLAELKRELGLPKNARIDTVKQAIAALREPQQTSEVDYDNLDPEVAARLESLNERIWAKNEALYGDVFVPEARTLYEQTIKERDPDKFVERVLEFVLAVTEGDEDGEPADEQQPAPQRMPELGSADVPVVPRTNNADPTGGKRDTGDMLSFVRGKLGIPTPPPR